MMDSDGTSVWSQWEQHQTTLTEVLKQVRIPSPLLSTPPPFPFVLSDYVPFLPIPPSPSAHCCCCLQLTQGAVGFRSSLALLQMGCTQLGIAVVTVFPDSLGAGTGTGEPIFCCPQPSLAPYAVTSRSPCWSGAEVAWTVAADRVSMYPDA